MDTVDRPVGLESRVATAQPRRHGYLPKQVGPFMVGCILAFAGLKAGQHIKRTQDENLFARVDSLTQRVDDLYVSSDFIPVDSCMTGIHTYPQLKIVGLGASDEDVEDALRYNATIATSYLTHYSKEYAPLARKLDERTLTKYVLVLAATESALQDVNPLTGMKTVSWTGAKGLSQAQRWKGVYACVLDVNRMIAATGCEGIDARPINDCILFESSIEGVREQARFLNLYTIWISNQLGSDLEKIGFAYNKGVGTFKALEADHGASWRENLDIEPQRHLKNMKRFAKVCDRSTITAMVDNLHSNLSKEYADGKSSRYVKEQTWRTHGIRM